MSLTIRPTIPVSLKGVTYESLLQKVKDEELTYQELLDNETRLAKKLGQEQFDELLDIATTGKANFK